MELTRVRSTLTAVAVGMTLLLLSAPQSAAAAQTAPQGGWLGTYGADGYVLGGWNGSSDVVSLPQGRRVSVEQGKRWVWQTNTSDGRALRSPDGSGRRAATLYDETRISVRLNFDAAYSGQLHLYALDFGTPTARRERITVDDGSGATTVALDSDFTQGAWVTVPINVAAGGAVRVTVDRTAGVNAVLSGIFLGGAPTPPGGGGVSQGRPFAASSLWNTPLPPDATLDPASARLVARLGQLVESDRARRAGPWINTTQFSTPVYTVAPDQTKVRVKVDSDLDAPPALQEAFDSVPIPSDARPAAGSDGHMAIWQPSTDRMWEFWQAQRRADGWHATWGGAMSNVSNNPGYFTAAVWPGAKPNWGATASSLPLLGGLIRVAEARAGRIDHALAIALPEIRALQYALPAQRTDGSAYGPDTIPEGARFRLDPNLDIDALDLPAPTKAIAEAAQRYGIVVRDYATNVAFVAEDPAGVAAAGQNPWNDVFGGQRPDDLLARFPWNRLQLVRMQLSGDDEPVPPPAACVPQNGPTVAPGFPIGVWQQPSSSFAKWRTRGVNTIVEDGALIKASSFSTWRQALECQDMFAIRPPQQSLSQENEDGRLLALSQPYMRDIRRHSFSDLQTSYSQWKAAAPDKPVLLRLWGPKLYHEPEWVETNRWTWTAQTSDRRALQSASGSSRTATTWYDPDQFVTRLDFSSAYSGQLHLYAVDWDAKGRRQTIAVDDGSGARTVTLGSDFSQGAWVTVPISAPAGGAVKLTVTRTAGPSAVLSGIFLGGPGTTSSPVTRAPQGDWRGVYGADGYVLAGRRPEEDVASLGNTTVSVGVVDKKKLFQSWTSVADWVAADIYPVSDYDRPEWVDLSQTPDPPTGSVLDTLQGWSPGKRYYAFIEASNLNGAPFRAPTDDEFRGQIWHAVIHGAQGVIYHAAGDNRYDATPADIAAEMVRQNATLSRLAPILAAPGGRLAAPGPFEVATRTYCGVMYRFVLNFSHQQAAYQGATYTPYEVAISPAPGAPVACPD